MWKRYLCALFGHRITRLDVASKTAECYRCKADLKVSYDMAYGGAIVESASSYRKNRGRHIIRP